MMEPTPFAILLLLFLPICAHSFRIFIGAVANSDPFSDGNPGEIFCVDLSDDETKIVIGTGEPKVKIYDFTTLN